jgi:hypothetical protein
MVPAHRRRGLAQTVMCGGLRRAKRVGAGHAGLPHLMYSPPAHALYASVDFMDYDVWEPWNKEVWAEEGTRLSPELRCLRQILEPRCFHPGISHGAGLPGAVADEGVARP